MLHSKPNLISGTDQKRIASHVGKLDVSPKVKCAVSHDGSVASSVGIPNRLVQIFEDIFPPGI